MSAARPQPVVVAGQDCRTSVSSPRFLSEGPLCLHRIRPGVRLDKFLQLSRLVRRRTLANSLCHGGRVALNGRPAVPSASVRPGDVITIEMGARRIRARVRSLPAARRGSEEYVDVIGEDRLD